MDKTDSPSPGAQKSAQAPSAPPSKTNAPAEKSVPLHVRGGSRTFAEVEALSRDPARVIADELARQEAARKSARS
jgi:hypothetical protein